MKNHNDIERINRYNFRSSLEALAGPGKHQKLQPLFGSMLQAMASVLLYSEVSYCYKGNEDFQMIQALCGAKISTAAEADYLFYDHPGNVFLFDAKVGTAENPELGATLIVKCQNLGIGGTPVILSGPGIKTITSTTLPVDRLFLEQLKAKNESFPIGVDTFLLSDTGQLVGVPRTTRIEVAQ